MEKMKENRKRLKIFTKKRLLIVSGILLLLPLLIFTLLHFKFARDAIKNIIIDNIKEDYNIVLTIESLDYNLLKPRVTLKNITIDTISNREKKRPPLFHARSVTVEAPWSLIWKTHKEITLINIEAPRFHIFIDENGKSNLPALPDQTAPTKRIEPPIQEKKPLPPRFQLPDIVIRKMQVPGIGIHYEDKSSGRKLNIPDASLEILYRQNARHVLRFKTGKRGILGMDNREYNLNRFNLHALLEPKTVRIETMGTDIGGIRLNLKGSCRDIDSNPRFQDITLDISAPLKILETLVPRAARMASRIRPLPDATLKIETKLHGTFDNPDLTGSIELVAPKGNSLKNDNNPVILNGSMTWKSRTLEINDFQFNWPQVGEIRADARVNPFNWVKGNRLDLKFDRIHLDTLTPFLQGENPVAFSIASGSAKIRWTGFAHDAVSGQVKIGIRPALMEESEHKAPPGHKPVRLDLTANAEGGRLDVEIRRFQYQDIAMDGRLQWRLNSVEALAGDFQLNIDTPQTLLPLPLENEPIKLTGSIRGTILKPRLNLTFQNSLLDALTLQASYDSMLPLPVQATLTIANLEPGYFLNRVWIDHSGFTGNITGNIRVQLDPARPMETIHMDAHFDSLSLHDQKTEIKNDGPLIFSFKQNALSVQQMKLTGNNRDLSLSLSGFLPLDATLPGTRLSTNADTGLHLQARANLTALGTFFPGVATRGRVQIDSSLNGALKAPEITASVRLDDAAVSSPSLPGSIEKASLHLEFKNNQIFLHSGRFNFMDIPITLSLGKMQWDNRRVIIDDFSFQGADSRLRIDGNLTFVPTEAPNIDLILDGSVAFPLINRFAKDISLDGKNRFRFHLTGNTSAPEIQGTLQLNDLSLQMQEPDIDINRFNGTLKFENQHIRIQKMSGNFNGGTLAVSGEYSLPALPGQLPRDGKTIPNTVTLDFKNAKFDYPEGMQSEFSGKVVFQPGTLPGRFRLGGQLNMIYGVYKDIPGSGPGAQSDLRPVLPNNTITSGPSIMDAVDLDIFISTLQPLWIEKSMARAEIYAGLNLTGTAARPGLTGRVTIRNGSEIYFNDHTFTVEKGVVNFNDPARIVPDLNIEANTRISSYDIVLRLRGTPEHMTPELISDPVLPKPDIMSLLLTGRLREDVPDAKFDYQKQGLSLLRGAILGIAEKRIREYTGLDSVRIDTGDQDKDASITFGKYITSTLELLYSQDLNETGKKSFTARYAPIRHILLEARKNMDNQYGMSFNHRILFDLHKRHDTVSPGRISPGSSTGLVKKPVISTIEIKSDTGLQLPLGTILRKIRQKEGKPFNYYRLNRDIETLENVYREKNFLGIDIRPRRFETGDRVRLVLSIEPGPKVSFRYRGLKVPRRIRKEIREIMTNGKLARHAREDALLRLQYFLYSRGFYKGRVSVGEINLSPRYREYRFLFQPGRRYTRPQLHFTGRTAVSYDQLKTVFKDDTHLYSVFSNPQLASAAVKHVYFNRGYLDAHVSPPRVEFDPGTQNVSIDFYIVEGPRYIIGDLKFQKATFFDTRELSHVTGLKIGDVFSPQAYWDATAKITARYRRQGFLNTTVTPRLTLSKTRGVIDLAFDIIENHRAVIGQIVISGNYLTKTYIIRRRLAFKKGDDITVAAINRTRNNLYNLDIFDQVEIACSPMTPVNGEKTIKYRVEIRVKERKQFGFKYGFNLKSTFERDAHLDYGITAQLTNYNMFGRGQYLDLVLGWGSREKSAVSYLGIPFFLGKKVKTRIFAHYRDKKDPFPLIAGELGIRQYLEMGEYSMLSYGYKVSWNREDEPLEDTVYRYRVAGPGVSFRRDSRNDIMDAQKGTYQNYSLELATQALGSQVDYIRFSSHFSYYRKIGPVVYAGAVRLGLLKDFGIDAPHGEKFYAGGGTTIRGFGQDKVGPLAENKPLGGNASLILNQELRWRFSKLFGAVVFFDAGNVYPRIRDITLRRFRESAGIGLRLHTPFVLLRFDLGFKLDRRPGEAPYTFFLSIGQAF